ncbi:hypothetical protein PNOK_0645100 [Pyrrhoderma noxium]|uniref:DUF6533 domain-containing protein n=1 Tax=Pyrrhoderma noxium TaxID=2282107 RepID=A0A286UEP8_9AGAM|nr:hypothetical protein PNOK_0645100 [Pyrrhoderma noxium]
MDGLFDKEIANGLNSLFALHCCLVSVTSLLVYDSLLCLSDEVSLVWLSGLRGNSGKKKSSILRYLYVTSRLLAFLLCSTVIYTTFPISVKRDIWRYSFLDTCLFNMAASLHVLQMKVLIDTFLVFCFIYNAFSLPRLEYERLMKILYRDGFQFFLVIITMRIINVAFTATNKTTLFAIWVVPSGIIVTVVSLRVSLRLFREDHEDEEALPLNIRSQCIEQSYLDSQSEGHESRWYDYIWRSN